MLNRLLLTLAASGFALAAESFESQPSGAFSTMNTDGGVIEADAGHAVVLRKFPRTGKNALHIQGGQGKGIRFALAEPLADEAEVSCWVQRWTAHGPFEVRLLADTPGGEVVLDSESKMRPGGYTRQLRGVVPAGTTALRLVSTTHPKGGVLVDDFALHTGAMEVQEACLQEHGVYPMLKKAPINPVLSYKLTTTGASSPVPVQEVRLRVHPADAVEEVTLRTCNYDRSIDGTNGMKFSKSIVYGKARPAADGSVSISCSGNLQCGENVLWVDARPAAGTQVGSKVTFEPLGITAGGKTYAAKGEPVTQRVGVLVAVPDASVKNPCRNNEMRACKTYRIPGLIRTHSGALLGCFDARYENHLDLSADIDVAVVRSEDGGLTWSEPSVAMDAGPGKGNGCGDPCILQDADTGRIWIQALATHFDRNPCLLRSRPGYDPADTGQWEMVYSDDDGKTWSKNINITREIKQYQWTTILAGPGCGIYTSKGVIVFPAQIWDFKHNPASMSTICYSTDNGKTWHYGNGVPHRTSECQVVELQDGSLMLSCRNETFQGRRAIFVTRDLGKTWEPHSTHLNTLKDPACQASLIAADTPGYGRILLYSHPDSSPKWRNTMSIHLSRDDGRTWGKGLVYDSRECWGYSCMAMVDDATVGLFYEPSHVSESNDYHGIGFLRIPLSEIAGEAGK